MNSITKRWVRGSLFFTLAVVLVAEVIFLTFTIQGYYNGVRVAIQDQFTRLRTQLSLMTSATAEEKTIALVQAVEQFGEKAKFELMLVSGTGSIEVTSSGIAPDQSAVTDDIREALLPGETEGKEFIGRLESGERVMAVTQKTPFAAGDAYAAGDIVAMRLVTSLTLVDKAVVNVVFWSVLLLLAIVMASVISGVFFIRSIVIPLRNVEATAARIAQGDFDTRIETKSNDEIGNLCKTINHMAEELSRSERMKNEFISSVSHELRTPLTSIKGWTETVGQLQNPADPNFRRGVEIIAGETDRLYGMVEELLDFSRMQHGLSLSPELLDLAAEVEDAVMIAQQRANNLGLALAYEAPELPVPVMGDKNRIRQVLINVLDNAMKYSFPGGTISAEILLDAANAFVLIKDQGQGITPEDLENVKLRFYKGKGAVRGSGIGLAVVDEIMTAHGGALEITSEAGHGTDVTLRFPLHKREDAPAGQA